MFASSVKLRKLHKKEVKGEIDEEEKKSIHASHGFVFFILGMCFYPNTDTSLLTQKLFHCENFTNDSMFYHNICLLIVGMAFTLLGGKYDFTIFICSVWAALFCHISHILLGVFGNSTKARNLFILVFGVMGMLRASISFTCPHVVSKLFLDSAYILFTNSRSSFSLIFGSFQAILNKTIGSTTIRHARLNMVLCHGFQAIFVFLGAVWITIVYLKYKDKNIDHSKDDYNLSAKQIKEKFAIFKYLKYYFPRFALIHICSVKYIFHTGLIPFLLELPTTAKLNGSIFYTLCEFMGRNIILFMDETIYTKPGDMIDNIYFILRDIPLYVLISLIIGLNGTILYSTFSGKLEISRRPTLVILSLMVSGFTYGYVISKGMTGSRAILEYYRKRDPNIPKESKVVNDVITITLNCSLFIPDYTSKVIQKYLRKSRVSTDYIISRNYGNLSRKDVLTLLSIMNK